MHLQELTISEILTASYILTNISIEHNNNDRRESLALTMQGVDRGMIFVASVYFLSLSSVLVGYSALSAFFFFFSIFLSIEFGVLVSVCLVGGGRSVGDMWPLNTK